MSNPLWRKQKAAVDETLEDMGVADKPTIVMLNKIDALQVHQRTPLPCQLSVCQLFRPSCSFVQELLSGPWVLSSLICCCVLAGPE